MAGTKEGGLKAAATNKAKYGDNFYSNIGKMGGSNGSPDRGFGSEKVGKDGLTGRERARLAGEKGGKKSKRGPSKQTKARIKRAKKLLSEGLTIEQIAEKMEKTVPTICEYIYRGQNYDI